jgi:hypothetical protein
VHVLVRACVHVLVCACVCSCVRACSYTRTLRIVCVCAARTYMSTRHIWAYMGLYMRKGVYMGLYGLIYGGPVGVRRTAYFCGYPQREAAKRPPKCRRGRSKDDTLNM